MKWLDMHCDTLMLKIKEEALPSLYANEEHIDFSRMKKGDYLGQFFAVFMKEENTIKYKGKNITDWQYINLLRNFLIEEVDEHRDLIQMAYTYEDILKNEQKGLMSAILTLEDARPIGSDLDNIKRLHDLGFRVIGLTWNYENTIGFPNSLPLDPNNETKSNVMDKGLTVFGKEAIRKMMSLGMVVDVSHLSDGGFRDVVTASREMNTPFVASHSNARAQSNHPRNLTDEMVRELASCGGCMGLNFAPFFLTEEVEAYIKLGKKAPSKISDMMRHLLHLKNVGGVEILAMGTDFDGIGGELEIKGAAEMPKLADALVVAGFSPSETDKITRKNVERVLQDSMF